MTKLAVAAVESLQARIIDTARTFTDHEWVASSACAGWRVRDVVAHMGTGARAIIDPIPLPDGTVIPENREREHDLHVDLRRDWSHEEVLAEFEKFGGERLTRLPALQDEPPASSEIEIPGLGTYPMHAVANAIAFDYFCHLYHDICAPAGPVDRDLAEPTHEEILPVVEWMMWGLPQMQGPELDDALIAPLTIRLTGPGESTWTIRRPDPAGGLVVDEGDGGDVVVTSSAVDFVSWGTSRSPWQAACIVDGDLAAATSFLSTLDIV